MKEVSIENDFMKLSFLGNGILSSLYNNKTDTEFINRSAVKPGPGQPFSPWKLLTTLGKWYEHPIYNIDQEVLIEKTSSSSLGLSYPMLQDLSVFFRK